MTAKDDKRFKFRGPKSLLDKVLKLAYFEPDEDGETAIPFHRVDGKGKLLVVAGDNASGKSFFRRIVQGFCQHTKTECIAISAEGRRMISHAPWMTFVYGDEMHESTGVNSTLTVLTGIKTSRGRNNPHVVFWDEPDLGLSESWAAGIGESICEYASDPPKTARAIVVVTHSRALVERLLPARPFYLHLGKEPEKAPQRLQDWLQRPIEARNPADLPDESYRRFKLIQAILDSNKP